MFSIEDVNAKDGLGMTPLMHAVSVADPEMANFLLEKGAKTHSEDGSPIVDVYGGTVLYHALNSQAFSPKVQ